VNRSPTCQLRCLRVPVQGTAVALGMAKSNIFLKVTFLMRFFFNRCFFVKMNLYTLDEIKFKCKNNFQYTF